MIMRPFENTPGLPRTKPCLNGECILNLEPVVTNRKPAKLHIAFIDIFRNHDGNRFLSCTDPNYCAIASIGGFSVKPLRKESFRIRITLGSVVVLLSSSAFPRAFMVIPGGHYRAQRCRNAYCLSKRCNAAMEALGNALRVALKAAICCVRLAQCRITTIFTSLSNSGRLLEPLSRKQNHNRP